MKLSRKKILCAALSAVVMLQATACASAPATNEPEVDGTEIDSTVDDSVEIDEPEIDEPEIGNAEEAESAAGSGFQPTASTLVPLDYDAKVLANRNEDGSKKYVASDLAPTICYDNLSLGLLTESWTYVNTLDKKS